MTNTNIDIAPIIGLPVYLHRSKDRPCSCGKNIMQMAKAPHRMRPAFDVASAASIAAGYRRRL
jgi:hypothetical protein